MFWLKIGFSIGVGLLLYGNISLANSAVKTKLTIAQAEENSQTNKRPAPPQRIPPNRVKPGGGLDANRQSCTQNGKSLTALIPVKNPVLTSQAYPSFLFYIPDPAGAISHAELAIFTADEKSRIYSTKIVLPKNTTPGIIKITVPASLQYALQTNTYYHWYFRVYCENSFNELSSLNIDGWIERVATVNSKLQLESTSNDIWYDAIAEAADDVMITPESLTVRDRWLQMLQHINLEHLVNSPIFDIEQQLEGQESN